MSVETCPLCRESSSRVGSKDEYRIYRCGTCEFLFVHPYPTPEALREFYSSSYRGADATFYPKLKSRKRRAFLKSLRFFRFLYGKKSLDVGCGGGIMVNAFRRLGADSYGLDISENSIAFARENFPECTFFCESFEEMLKRGLTFDFVFTTELMEHLPGPHECVDFMSRVTKPGSVVYVAAPDAGHSKVPADIMSWEDICPPEHLQWFNRSNMERTFEAYGFRPLKHFKKKTLALSLLFERT